MDPETTIETEQYLIFKLDQELFAMEIYCVHEVLEFSQVTRVPKAPEFLRGVINLRGGVVALVDMKMKLNMGKTEPTIDTCVIVLEINLEEQMSKLGVLTDSIPKVVHLDSSRIIPAPRIGTRLDVSFIKGIGNYNEELIIILNVEKLFSIQELTSASATKAIKSTYEMLEEEKEMKLFRGKSQEVGNHEF